jgi:hypothetical protein
MSIITKVLKGTCVYWPPGGSESGGVDFDDYGQPSYGSPVELDCRWEDVSVEFLDSQGTLQTSHAVVMVGSDVAVGGVLFNGNLAGVSDLTAPKNNDGAWEIKRFDKTPNFRYTEYLREAYL